ncbi:hypothetical protein AAGW05_00110 [Arthrobacter sp. LAPM80]|uniref:hypothetical protein n=1 Tax=Arthrobacter sp. LAPM80 TaxID=3141788 RepID=UPI00398B27B5
MNLVKSLDAHGVPVDSPVYGWERSNTERPWQQNFRYPESQEAYRRLESFLTYVTAPAELAWPVPMRTGGDAVDSQADRADDDESRPGGSGTSHDAEALGVAAPPGAAGSKEDFVLMMPIPARAGFFTLSYDLAGQYQSAAAGPENLDPEQPHDGYDLFVNDLVAVLHSLG